MDQDRFIAFNGEITVNMASLLSFGADQHKLSKHPTQLTPYIEY